MKITVPHLGKLFVFIKVLFESLDVDYVLPPPCSKKTLEIGSKYSPEMSCLPLKINLGNFMESIEQGAEAVVITAAAGPCRFGYYCKMHEEMLKDMGYGHIKVIALDPYEGIFNLLKNVKQVFGTLNILKISKSGATAYRLMSEVDKNDKLSYYTRPREKVKGSTNAVMRAFTENVYRAKNTKEIKEAIKKAREELNKIELDDTVNPIKIGIVGEIYTIIEPSTNLYMEEILGDMGIEIDKTLTITKWTKEHLFNIHNPKEFKEYNKACKPYLSTPIGGHARETIGHSVTYALKGYDGIIQIYPLTCMPEIVAASILPTVSKDYEIPLLTIVIDEITGDAGYKTRIEAFKDLLLKKREAKSNDTVLCGN